LIGIIGNVDEGYISSILDNDGDVDFSADLASKVRVSISTHLNHLYSRAGVGDGVVAVENIAKMTGKSVFNLDASDLDTPVWGRIENNNQLSVVFVNYRDAALRNSLKELGARDGGYLGHLGKKEFEEKFGRPPWFVVDDVLRDIGLGFTIRRPDMLDYTPYEPMLLRKTDMAEVPFNQLSSGEVVLLNLALSFYQRWDKRVSVADTRLLLLDEVDAPLHPAMSRSYINTIVDEIHGRQGVSVIATTHSMRR
jgi:hypothetical protein